MIGQLYRPHYYIHNACNYKEDRMSQANNPIESEHSKHSVNKEKKENHAAQQEPRDKTLKDSFPASDPPPFE